MREDKSVDHRRRLAGVTACGTPTSPDTRLGFIDLQPTCNDTGAIELVCAARTYCAGLYRCPDPSRDNVDVTAEVRWSIDYPGVIRQGSRPNTFVAVAPGFTTVTAHIEDVAGIGTVRVAVFDGIQAPLVTAEVWGAVTEGATTPRQSISGAVVSLVGPIIGSQTMLSGSTPVFIPGHSNIRGSVGFQFFGIPRGTYELTVRADGYETLTQTVTVRPPGSTLVETQLRRVMTER